MTIAVVVSTRNRAERLPRALAALEVARARHAGPSELVIIDNGSTDATPELLSSWSRSGDGRLALRVPEPGKSRALNSYLPRATADILAFTDDDAEVSPDWLASTSDFLARHPEYGAATGPIRPPPGLDDSGVLRHLDLFGFKLPFRTEAASEHETTLIVGVNMAIRRLLLVEAGGFDVRLGAGAMGFCEDDELGDRLRRRGTRLGYNPTAEVHHDVDTDRLTFEAALDRAVRAARCDFVAYRQRYGVVRSSARFAEVAVSCAVARLGDQDRAVKKRIRLAYQREVFRLAWRG